MPSKVHTATKQLFKNGMCCGHLMDKISCFFCCRNCPYSQISQHSKDSSVKDIGDEVKQSGQSQESIYSLTRFWKTDHIDIV